MCKVQNQALNHVLYFPIICEINDLWIDNVFTFF